MSTNSGPGAAKRRCVSTACIACRRRKSKLCGVFLRIYDPNSDHRRKGVYRKDVDALRTRNTTLQILIQAILNYDEDDSFELVRRIRSCDSLEDVAESIIDGNDRPTAAAESAGPEPGSGENTAQTDQFEAELAGKMSELVLDGSRKFIGGTSNLVFLPPGSELCEFRSPPNDHELLRPHDRSVSRWTRVTDDERLIDHLMTMYFTWHYPFFTALSKDLFYRDYTGGHPSQYCSSLLVNAMLALGCHFTSWEGARKDPYNPATAGDHFFKEAKRLLLENDEHENAKLCTVQAFALMSVREAGCGRESKGWVYSGMSFRMAFDLGLNLDIPGPSAHGLSEEEIDARRITFWGCFLIDKCWSNYLGRQPQLSVQSTNVPKFDAFPSEEAQLWVPYTDTGAGRKHMQPSRTRAVALHISTLCEISGDLLAFFYHPATVEKPFAKQLEVKKLSETHTRLEGWKKALPEELEPKDGQLAHVLVMHMFYQLLFIHLYRPFLKYTKSNSPLPQHVSPRKLCVQAASAISKLLRIYKRTYGFSQIVNFVVYIAHTACTVHLLNLPEKNAQRDIIHGLKSLEEMGEYWLCARRTLRILDISASKWRAELPREAVVVFERTHARWGSWGSWDQMSSPSMSEESPGQTMLTSLASSASPSNFSPAEGQAHLAPQHNQFQMHRHTAFPASMSSYYPPASSSPASASVVPSGQRTPSVPFQRHQFALPEPTYLRPMMNASYPLQAVPLSQQEMWYNNPNPQEHRVAGMTSRQQQEQQDGGTPATSGMSPMTVYDPSANNFVDASRYWWSRDNSLPLGAESWSQGWNSGVTNGDGGVSVPIAAFNLPFDNNMAVGVSTEQVPSGTSVIGASSSPPSTLQQRSSFPIVSAPAVTGPATNLGMSTDGSTNLRGYK